MGKLSTTQTHEIQTAGEIAASNRDEGRDISRNLGHATNHSPVPYPDEL
ncbi:uncharacterized protein METZ01_LOCUS262903, partial [marine metagenome]